MDNEKMTIRSGEYRPCLVKGRRALFHRWTDSARPVRPWGMEEDEKALRFQVWSVHGIVEYEDGTVARVWPSDIQFVDGGYFADYTWPQIDEEGLPYTFADNQEATSTAKKPVADMACGVGYYQRRYNCPTCGKRIATYTYGKEWTENGLSQDERVDCYNCGQAIDWEGVPLPGEHITGDHEEQRTV